MQENNISIEEFLKIAGVKRNTVIKHKDEIPGLLFLNGEFRIIKGTRYPCFYKDKIRDFSDRRYLLLKAISENKYIDYLKLRVYPDQFQELLRELLDAELIRENNMPNHYGANAYDSTYKGDDLLKMRKEKSIIEIANMVATAAGHFVGAVVSDIVQ